MTASPHSLDPASPFKFIAGDRALDFVNTVDWTERGLELDRFASYPRLLEWAGPGARALSNSELDGLRRAATRDAYAAEQVVRDAVALRELLERTFSRLVRGKPFDNDLALLNQGWLHDTLGAMAITSAPDSSLVLGWPEAATRLQAPLWSVAWAAAKLLTSDDASRVRRCGGIDCGWYYVDRSRNGLRRWCEMETCGTIMKTRRRAARNASARERSAHAR